MKTNIYACLLAGGKGTRLWPLSTERFSKSFVRIGKRKPLIVETIDRLRGLAGKKNVIIVVDKAQSRLLRKSVKGIPQRNILVEPFGRSTASAIGLAAIKLKADDIMVVLPTDALIKESSAFRKTIKSAIKFVKDNENVLLCIGIKPKSPSTAYGYIKIKSRRQGIVYSVDKFIEKPDAKKATELIKKPKYLWNAGMFVFRVKSILRAMKANSPLLYKELQRIKRKNKDKEKAYKRMKNVSIDYQIMEKTKNLYCAKGNFRWCDLGSWNSMGELLKSDRNGNLCFGKSTLMNTKDSIVYNSKNKDLGIIGLKNVIVVQTRNGMLVCDKKDAEQVKDLVTSLK